MYAWAKHNDIHVIADEIMTGMGRTGKMFAYQYSDIEPDFVCLSKGLTSGWMAFSAILVNQSIAALFSNLNHRFLHSHTFSGHALAGSIALEVLAIIEEENLIDRANKVGQRMIVNMQCIADKTKKLTNLRQIGAVVAADLIGIPSDKIGQRAIEHGVLLRPLGKTIYWLPPLNIDFSLLDQIADRTEKTIVSLTRVKKVD